MIEPGDFCGQSKAESCLGIDEVDIMPGFDSVES
jgi:hypothetical protein